MHEEFGNDGRPDEGPGVGRKRHHGEIHSLPVAHPIMANAEAHLIKRSGRKLSFAAQAMLQAMAGQLQCLR